MINTHDRLGNRERWLTDRGQVQAPLLLIETQTPGAGMQPRGYPPESVSQTP